jgi:hypothetical protein
MSVVRTFSPIDFKTGKQGPPGPTGPIGNNGPMNLFITTNTNSIAPGSTGTLTSSDSILQYLSVEAQLFVAGSSNPGYLDIVGYTEPNILTVKNTYNDNAVSWTAGNNVLIVGVQKNGGPNVITRGNPGTGEILPLISLDTSHYYTGSGTVFDIPTQMVENGIYEVYFNCSSANNSNNDFYLYPNSTIYSPNTFYTVFQNGTGITPVLNYTHTNSSGFYVDYFAGSYGWNPMGKFIIYNGKYKKVRFEMGDTSAAVIGTGYWTDGSGFTPDSGTSIVYDINTTWNTIGRISFPGKIFNNWNVWVKRIA